MVRTHSRHCILAAPSQASSLAVLLSNDVVAAGGPKMISGVMPITFLVRWAGVVSQGPMARWRRNILMALLVPLVVDPALVILLFGACLSELTMSGCQACCREADTEWPTLLA